MDKKSIFGAFQFASEKYKLPNGEEVVLRELKSGERSRINANHEKDDPHSTLAWVVACGCEGFSEEDIKQIQENIPDREVQKMASVIMRLSGMGEEAEDEKKE